MLEFAISTNFFVEAWCCMLASVWGPENDLIEGKIDSGWTRTSETEQTKL